MDVTDKASILTGNEVDAANDGKLHILVNKCVLVLSFPWTRLTNQYPLPIPPIVHTHGRAADHTALGSSASTRRSCTTRARRSAFLGLLAAGSADVPAYTSSVFAYNTTKAAASHLSKMFATEFALKKVPVRVNAVAPGIHESEMTYDVITPEILDRAGKNIVPIPTRRPGTAQEIAESVIYLASPAGCYTNGQEIVVDGEYLAVNPSTA
ncbi:NAD(P)-binding protein [Wolfiporia cocos MD-104 SS10]|uniref:NAD(P)-binding protein n=1 Tax=Wolfiporia cocos (strain MD-104) TaxID=742152 RepID=A0A2H3JW93_WOLCO|nr:NAD(P)-binding protein [Wolfiporia cocos MD-104 SS10]